MKFYMIYEQAFPLGFGLAALLCLSVGIWGLATRKPIVFPFILSFLSYLGILIPLFLLSLNHFLEAWPLGLGTMLLNGVGIIVPPIWLFYLWHSRFELTAIGAAPEVVTECLKGNSSETRVPFRRILWGRVCYLGTPPEESANFAKVLREQIVEKSPHAMLGGYVFCLFAGILCAATASISWCSAARCWAPF